MGWSLRSANGFCRPEWTHHFVVDFVEMNLADFVDHVLALKRDEAKAWNRKNRCRLIIDNERRLALLPSETVR